MNRRATLGICKCYINETIREQIHWRESSIWQEGKIVLITWSPQSKKKLFSAKIIITKYLLYQINLHNKLASQ